METDPWFKNEKEEEEEEIVWVNSCKEKRDHLVYYQHELQAMICYGDINSYGMVRFYMCENTVSAE